MEYIWTAQYEIVPPAHIQAGKANDSRMQKAITKTCLFKYTENFTSKKCKFSDKKNSDIFHVSTQNIDC